MCDERVGVYQDCCIRGSIHANLQCLQRWRLNNRYLWVLMVLMADSCLVSVYNSTYTCAACAIRMSMHWAAIPACVRTHVSLTHTSGIEGESWTPRNSAQIATACVRLHPALCVQHIHTRAHNSRDRVKNQLFTLRDKVWVCVFSCHMQISWHC